MAAYYNEFDPYMAQWLQNLIADGLIAAGDVDERSIADVRPEDLRGYTQHHFFAGLGGWAYALRLAGWPDERPVWTGSCPCQPFSNAGKQKGQSDERHLWPVWSRLIGELAPHVVFGEQVAAAVGFHWLDAVLDDLEARHYAVGAAVLPACSVGAPHIRQRLWFVADADKQRESQQRPRDQGPRQAADGFVGDRATGLMANTMSAGRAEGWAGTGDGSASGCGATGLVGDADDAGPQGRVGSQGGADQRPSRAPGLGPWSDLEWLPCSDGKWRPTQPGLFPLSYGVSARVGRLRAYGNAIVPQVAAEFIAAYIDLKR